MNTTITNLIYAGSFAVDSGQAMVGDPCYLDEWKKWEEGEPFEHEERAGEYGYIGASGVTIADTFGQVGGMNAVAFATGYGDGLYPVFIQVDQDGRVMKVVIDFEGDMDLDE